MYKEVAPWVDDEGEEEVLRRRMVHREEVEDECLEDDGGQLEHLGHKEVASW